jgi:hypothetical protein
MAILLSGCGGSSVNTPNLPVTKQFQFNGVDNFTLSQAYNTSIIYHTEDEMRDMLNEKITGLLEEKGLLSDDKNMDTLKIQVDYYRVFLGEATFAKTESLGHPHGTFIVEITNNKNVTLRKIVKNNLVYTGGFLGNLQGLTGYRDKSKEVDFIQGFVNSIVETIEELD